MDCRGVRDCLLLLGANSHAGRSALTWRDVCGLAAVAGLGLGAQMKES